MYGGDGDDEFRFTYVDAWDHVHGCSGNDRITALVG